MELVFDKSYSTNSGQKKFNKYRTLDYKNYDEVDRVCENSTKSFLSHFMFKYKSIHNKGI